jgi:adenylate kinase family enzyme
MENHDNPYNKYHNGKIYKITDIAYTECYIGSTVQPLCNRMAEHRKHYQRYNNGKENSHISSYILFDKYGVENCKIELIEEYACQNKAELEKREGHYIKHEDCLNKVVAGRSRREHYNECKEIIIRQRKKYYDDNREKVREAQKSYHTRNAEKLKQYMKKYYETTREKQNERKTERIECDICHKLYSRTNLQHHKKVAHDEDTTYRNKISAMKREKLPCVHCNKLIARHYMGEHIKRVHATDIK